MTLKCPDCDREKCPTLFVNTIDDQGWSDADCLKTQLAKARAQLDAAARPAAWRKEPPTVEEVKACRWWWCDDGDPRPMRLTVNELGRVVEVVDGHEIPVEEMEAEWAPCVRPGGAGLVEAALRAIDEEPELPGEPPQEMVAAMMADPAVAIEALRIAVRQTKAGIRERLRAALPKETP